MEDKDATVRAAGVTAFAKPGGGRPALYRLQPLLQDTSPDVRAAAAGAMVRSCGDLALPFVQPLFKERDDRALVAMAPELGRLKSPESADMLAKMMTRPGGELRLAVTRGLVERKDDQGKALKAKAFESIRHDAYASAELRGLVYADAPPEELLKQPRDPVLGTDGLQGAAARQAPRRGARLADREVRSPVAGHGGRSAGRVAGESAPGDVVNHAAKRAG